MSVDDSAVRDAGRADVTAWARLVLSLLLLGAPALAVGYEAGRDLAFLTGSPDLFEVGVLETDGETSRALDPALCGSPRTHEVRWREAQRLFGAQALTQARLHAGIELARYPHGRVVDPALYLQRAPR